MLRVSSAPDTSITSRALVTRIDLYSTTTMAQNRQVRAPQILEPWPEGVSPSGIVRSWLILSGIVQYREPIPPALDAQTGIVTAGNDWVRVWPVPDGYGLDLVRIRRWLSPRFRS